MFPMDVTDFQKLVLEKASATRGYGGHAAASCRRHLERAWKLWEEMPEVSIFLAITAEEEAATAIFHGLRKRQYEWSKNLKSWDHKYKAGVYPFLQLLGGALSPPEGSLKLNLCFDSPGDQSKAETLRIRLPISIEGGEQYYIVPEPPLGFVSTGPDGKERDYTQEVRDVASEQGIESVFEYIKAQANERNKMLYASDSGIPMIENASEALQRHTKAALLNLIIYLLIEPHKKQSLPQEALYSYVKILSRIEAKET